MKPPEQLLEFPDRQSWHAWLEQHHAAAQEAWLVLYKASTHTDALKLAEAVEEALCFGWIDGLLKPLDARRYLLRFTPRRAGSVWSARNKQRVAKLTAEGRMMPAGLEKVAQAQASGEWEAARVREVLVEVPTDLEQALAGAGEARSNFLAYPASRKKMLLGWLASAKRPETRLKRIAKIVALARLGEKANFDKMIY